MFITHDKGLFNNEFTNLQTINEMCILPTFYL